MGANLFPMTIAGMGAYDFWAHPRALGLSDEDAESLISGQALPEVVDRMIKAGSVARDKLREAAANEPIARPS